MRDLSVEKNEVNSNIEKTGISLLSTFKTLLREKEMRSQDELAYELSIRGFTNISQSKVSRMLSKVGAVKTRNSHNKVIYQLPAELVIPKVNYSIDTIALDIKHNGSQIIVKTGAGGASLIARILDSLEESAGIMGTLAGDDTVLVIPESIKNIENIYEHISELLEITTH